MDTLERDAMTPHEAKNALQGTADTPLPYSARTHARIGARPAHPRDISNYWVPTKHTRGEGAFPLASFRPYPISPSLLPTPTLFACAEHFFLYSPLRSNSNNIKKWLRRTLCPWKIATGDQSLETERGNHSGRCSPRERTIRFRRGKGVRRKLRRGLRPLQRPKGHPLLYQPCQRACN